MTPSYGSLIAQRGTGEKQNGKGKEIPEDCRCNEGRQDVVPDRRWQGAGRRHGVGDGGRCRAGIPKSLGRRRAAKEAESDGSGSPQDNGPTDDQGLGSHQVHRPGGRVKFPLGHIVATPGALEAISAPGEAVLDYLERHLAGDWGDVCEEDRQENERSLVNGWRILSAYTLKTGVVIWVITEADRSSTCVLLPSEY